MLKTIIILIVCFLLHSTIRAQDPFVGTVYYKLFHIENTFNDTQHEEQLCYSGDSQILYTDNNRIVIDRYLKGIFLYRAYYFQKQPPIQWFVELNKLHDYRSVCQHFTSYISIHYLKDSINDQNIEENIIGRKALRCEIIDHTICNYKRSQRSSYVSIDTTLRVNLEDVQFISLRISNASYKEGFIAVKIVEGMPDSEIFSLPDLEFIEMEYPMRSDYSFATLSYYYYLQKKFTESVLFATAGITEGAEENKPWAAYYRGMAYIKLLEPDSACLDLSNAVRMGHNEAEDFFSRYCNDNAKIEILNLKLKKLILEKKYEEAIAVFDKIISIQPNDTLALYNRAVSKYNSGDRLGACQDINNAILAGAHGSDYTAESFCSANEMMIALFQAGIKALQMNQPLTAIDYFDDILIAFPESGAVYYRRGLAYLMLNQKEEAKSDLRKASDFGVDAALEKLEEIGY